MTKVVFGGLLMRRLKLKFSSIFSMKGLNTLCAAKKDRRFYPQLTAAFMDIFYLRRERAREMQGLSARFQLPKRPFGSEL